MNDSSVIAGILWMFLVASSVFAWFTHIIYSIMNEQFILLVAGAILFPIGIIHGWMVWFGFG